jgi:type IV pilus assembly protein PilB
MYYSGGLTIDELIEESINLASGPSKVKDEALVEEAPIVKLVNQFIIKGIKENATDIHMEPEEKILRIRYRIDGVMVMGPSVPKAIQSPIIARGKIISGANIAETRTPQDGRIKFILGRRNIDIRVSFFPTINGENVVMRLLDKSKLVLGMDKLGFSSRNSKLFKAAIERPYGMILVTGPTGSGKTTTLYSALAYLNSLEKNIITLEDPVEYEFPIIRQSQINPKINFTFAEGLRSILRQDPDIILVGEMRDKETIDMSIRSALTGHLVLSTLHTNNSISTITRLTDMGAEPFLISSTLILVVAQRLVRRLCEFCREPLSGEQALKRYHDLPLSPGDSFFQPKGCAKCNNSGYRGRMASFEVLHVSDTIRDMIEQRIPTQEILNQAVSEGFQSLFSDALEKARQGAISLDEAIRVAL